MATHCICGAMAPRTIQLVNGWADSNEYIVSADGPPMVAAVDDDPRDAHGQVGPDKAKTRQEAGPGLGLLYILYYSSMCAYLG
jgi:hypothetical protein